MSVQKAENKVQVDPIEAKYKTAIELHKKRGIDTWILTCETGETCLLRRPTTLEASKVIPLMNGFGFNADGTQKEPDMVGAGIRIVETCWVAGDDAIRRNEDLKAEVGLAAVSLIEIKIATLKKN